MNELTGINILAGAHRSYGIKHGNRFAYTSWPIEHDKAVIKRPGGDVIEHM